MQSDNIFISRLVGEAETDFIFTSGLFDDAESVSAIYRRGILQYIYISAIW